MLMGDQQTVACLCCSSSCASRPVPTHVLFVPPHAQSFPDGCQATCLVRGSITAAALGCALPAVLLRVLEQRSLATFARLLRAAAAGY